jgi:peptide/nickel transport system substrate-binding protein
VLRGINTLVVLLVLAATPAWAGRSDDTLRIAAEQIPESLDIYFNNVQTGSLIAHHVWDRLVERDPDTNEYRPSLATAWRWIDDRTLEFDLRQGVKFHNGAAFSADDVVYTVNYVVDPANRATSPQNLYWMARAEKITNDRVRIHLKAPFPAALEYLAGPIAIYPHDYYAAVGPRGMSEKPVGTGPYRVAEHQTSRRVRFEINRDYFAGSPRGKPSIGAIELRYIPDPDTQIAELLGGGIDWIYNLSQDQANRLTMNPEFTVVAGDTMRVAFLLLNSLAVTPTSALKDVRVRRALAHAIDRASILNNLVGAGGRIVDTICYPSQFGCGGHATRYDYDPVRARALLAEAGFAGGIDTDLYAYRDRVQTEAIQGFLRAVGIRAELHYVQAPALRDALRQKKTSLTSVTWGSFGINDVSAIVSGFFKFQDDDVTQDPELRDLLETADTTNDPQRRRQLYARAFERISDQAYAIPLYTVPANYAFTKDLQFKPYPDQIPRFWLSRWK